MGLLFFLLWLILNAHFAWDVAMLEIIGSGAVLSAAIWFFVTKFTRWTAAFDRFFLKNIHLFLAYLGVLFWNVLTSNFHVILLVLARHESPEPILVSLRIPLKNEMLRTLLANSVTLTPGTITVSLTEDHFMIHALRREFIDGFENCPLVRILQKLDQKEDIPHVG